MNTCEENELAPHRRGSISFYNLCAVWRTEDRSHLKNITGSCSQFLFFGVQRGYRFDLDDPSAPDQ